MKAAMTLAFVILAAVLGSVGVWVWWLGPNRIASDAVSPVSIGSLRLNVPGAYVRGGHLIRSGAVERFPDMQAAGLPPASTAQIAQQNALMLIFIAVIRADGGLDPADRPQEIYGRFLEPDTWQNPGGLVLRRFEAKSPYADEELFLAPPDGRAFSARCRRAEAQAAVVGETCLWRYRLNEQDVQVRFSPELLPQWEPLADGVRRLVEGWIAK
jgi:hypothetical protein